MSIQQLIIGMLSSILAAVFCPSCAKKAIAADYVYRTEAVQGKLSLRKDKTFDYSRHHDYQVPYGQGHKRGQGRYHFEGDSLVLIFELPDNERKRRDSLAKQASKGVQVHQRTTTTRGVSRARLLAFEVDAHSGDTSALIGAHFFIGKGHIGTVADIDGQAELNIPEKEFPATITISYVGFYTAKIQLDDPGKDYDIIAHLKMSPDVLGGELVARFPWMQGTWKIQHLRRKSVVVGREAWKREKD